MSDTNFENAVDLAIAGKWEESHQIVQDLDSPTACWIHAVLHRIEGDNHNARYWYSRAGQKVTDLQPQEELLLIKKSLS